MVSISGPNLIRSQSAVTDKDGNVRIPYLPPGRYTIVAHIARRIFTSEQRIEVNISRTSSVTLQVHQQAEVRSKPVKDQHRDVLSSVPTNANSFGTATRIPVTTRETKLLEEYDAPSVTGRAEPRHERSSAEPGKSSIPKNVRRAEIASTESTGPTAPSPSRSAVLSEIYQVGPGDVLDIRIISSSPTDRSTLFTVTSQGLVEHPMVGQPLKVLGLTTDEISDRIEQELKAKAITASPRALVAVREYVSHTIIVSGVVKDPGTKILKREAIPLYVILADAQPAAEAGRVSVISKGTSEITTVELSDPKSLTLQVRPGDVVSVQVTPKQYFYIGGEVKAPGEKSFRSGLTLTQAILAAGGLSSKVATVQVARESSNGRLSISRYKLDDINTGKLADPVLQQGDRITVAHR
jgi:polysaccharide export outer membrane protein